MKNAKELKQIADNTSITEALQNEAEITKKMILSDLERAASKGKYERVCWFKLDELPFLESFIEELLEHGYEVSRFERSNSIDLLVSWKNVTQCLTNNPS